MVHKEAGTKSHQNPDFFLNSSITYFKTLKIGTLDLARCFGLKILILHHIFQKSFNFFFESVETCILLNKLLFLPEIIEYAIIGNPRKDLIFLFLILFEPCLAGIIKILLIII